MASHVQYEINFHRGLEMSEIVYYIYVTKDSGEDKDWDVLGVYSSQENAESHKLSLTLSNEYKEVVIVPGPMIVYQEY
jgi:hypothetical protein